MSSSDKRGPGKRPALRRASIVTATLLVCGVAPAEMTDRDKPVTKTRPPPVESMARIVDKTPRSVLKCWQEGRLVFESSGVSLPEGGNGAMAIKGSNGNSVQLLDLRQGLCILEKTNG